MKLPGAHNLKLNLISVALYSLAFGLTYFLGSYLIKGFTLNWLFVGLCALIICLPLSKKSLTTQSLSLKTPSAKLQLWLKFAAIQLIFLCMFVSFYQALACLPLEGMDSVQLATFISKDLSWHWGFYPWPLVALLSGGMALFYYKKEQPILMGELIYPYGTYTHNPLLVYSLNVFCITPTSLWVWGNLGIFTLGLFAWLAHCLHLSLFYYSDLRAIIIVILLVSLHQTTAMKTFQEALGRVTHNHCWYALSYMAFMGFALLLFYGVFTLATLLSFATKSESVLSTYIIPYNNLAEAYQLVSYAWWTMSLTLLINIFAYYGKGFSIRYLFIAILSPAMIIYTLFPYVLTDHNWQMFLGISCFLAGLGIVKNNIFLSCGPFVPPPHFRLRTINKYVGTAFIFATAFITVFILSNVYGLQIFMMLFGLSAAFCFILLALTTFVHIIFRGRETHGFIPTT